MALTDNIGYILIAFVVIIALFLIVLFIIEKKLHKKILFRYTTRNESYLTELSKMKVEDSKKALKKIDKLARNFISEAFKPGKFAEYSQLEEYFKKRKNKKATEFTTHMTKLLYSKEKIDKKQIKILIDLLAELISANKIISKQEKAILDKKSQIIEKQKKKLQEKQK